MNNVTEGQLTATGLRVALVVSRFNSFVTERLLAGALDVLRRCGAADSDLEVVRVPGAWEIPGTARELALTGRYDAVICVGCIIRGGTPHFEYISTEVSRGITAAALETRVPLIFGVLTCDTLEQAIDRAGAKAGNKGAEWGMAAIEMGNLFRQIKGSR